MKTAKNVSPGGDQNFDALMRKLEAEDSTYKLTLGWTSFRC